ncbi:hypothetical protein [Mesorhizobium sp. LSJC280B00]|uniref:hypothetical protein n=1 Tax=Mesorhizobium sp. LSJC280B00 TaxID=1287336 RepID=UPI001FD9CE6C|nr:hypothetical protein [Mesorhizobium sp. LSJC280B00]
MDNLDLGLRQALQFVKRRIVTQILSRRIFTVERSKPECDVDHTDPPVTGPEADLPLRYHTVALFHNSASAEKINKS